MSEANRESLSALADGELKQDQVRFLLRRLDHDASLRDSWSRYQITAAALRRELPPLASSDFCARVMAGVEETTGAGVQRRWLRWSAGGAIAASVAAVALMVAQPGTEGNVIQAPGPASVAAASQASAARPEMSQPSAPVMPRWLSAASPASELAQPAAATFYGGDVGNVLSPATYSRQMAPYMNIRDYRNASGARVHVSPYRVPPQDASRTGTTMPRDASLH